MCVKCLFEGAQIFYDDFNGPPLSSNQVVVGLFAQRAPGKARSGSGDDSRSARLRWFVEALDVFGEQAGFGAGGRTGEGARAARTAARASGSMRAG